jgi:hypothetical protein
VAARKMLYRTDDGAIRIGYVIDHEDSFWLVPELLQGPTAGILCPARIICLDGLPQEPAPPDYDADLALTHPLHRDIVEGRRVSAQPLVIERPDIHLREDQDFHR